MPETRAYEVFSIEEMDDFMIARAYDKWYPNDLDYEWWDFIYEDAKTIGEILGITIKMEKQCNWCQQNYTAP